jgi:hypothetical protein
VPEIGLVAVFCPLMTTGGIETLIHTADGERFVVHCKVNPGALVGQIRITFVPAAVIVSVGGIEMLNNVP